MSGRRIMFIVMTLLSGVAFVIDRFVLSDAATPAAAEAAPLARAKSVGKAVPSAAESQEESSFVDPSLKYLDRLPVVASGRDVFAMSPEMVLYYKSLQEVQETQLTIGDHQRGRPWSAREFQANRKLEGTYTSLKEPLAVINGEVLKIGDEIDGFTLTQITPYGAELRRGRERVQLTFLKPGDPPDKVGSAPRPLR